MATVLKRSRWRLNPAPPLPMWPRPFIKASARLSAMHASGGRRHALRANRWDAATWSRTATLLKLLPDIYHRLSSIHNKGRINPMRKDLHEENRLSWNAATVAHNSHKGDQASFFRNGGN